MTVQIRNQTFGLRFAVPFNGEFECYEFREMSDYELDDKIWSKERTLEQSAMVFLATLCGTSKWIIWLVQFESITQLIIGNGRLLMDS